MNLTVFFKKYNYIAKKSAKISIQTNKTEEIINVNKPFKLKPTGKDYLWGGNKLNEVFHKNIEMSPLAETWECSTHPNGPSTVCTGEYSGKILYEVLKEHPEYLGKHPLSLGLPLGQLPILIKFINAKHNLSVQVHPSDEYAKEHENGSLGKTEMWYVLDADEGSQLIYGFSKTISKEEFKNSLDDGTVEKYLQHVDVKKGDVFLVESGTAHGIGAGTMVAEIQESSDLTYRMYDYNRVGKDGKKRELHIQRSLDVTNLNASPKYEHRKPNIIDKSDHKEELLCKCKYFTTERWISNDKEIINYQSDDSSFKVILVLEGQGKIKWNDDSFDYQKGDCIFVPANSEKIEIIGKVELLSVSC